MPLPFPRVTARFRPSHAGPLLSALLLFAVTPAQAQVFERTVGNLTNALQNVLNLRPSDTTDWHLGVGPYLAPAFEGSREYKVRPAPLISVRYRDVLKVDNNEVDFTAFDHVFGDDDDSGKLSVGPVINLDFGRSEKDSPALRGLGGVGTSVEIGGFAEYKIGGIILHFEISQDVAQGHKGAEADLETSFTLFKRGAYALSATPSVSWSSAPYMQSYFGIDAGQSAASGLAVYHPGSGFKSIQVTLAQSYDLSRHWSLFSTTSYQRLLPAAADSPLIVQRGTPNQFTVSGFVVYKF